MIKRTLYFSHPAYLSLKDNQMVVKLPEVENCKDFSPELKESYIRTIPIEDIGMIVVDNKRVTFTSGLTAALLENNSSIVVCDNKSLPTGLMMPLSGNSIQSERFRDQLNASVPLKKQLWQQTMMQKIANQKAVLQKYTTVECGCMEAWSKEVKSGDPNNLEARAAVYYWKNVFTTLPDFIRDREGSYPNNFLNYGYAILRAVVARALVGSGLLPTLGIHHQNRYNAYCLADDIMEPYRPFIDQLVLETMNKYPEVYELTKEIKTSLLIIPTLDVTIKGKRSPLMIAATQTTASLAKCYSGELRKIEYPEL